MDEIRDRELGERLEILAEPDHGPDYWDQLRLQIAEAAAERRRASAPHRLRALLGSRRVRTAAAAVALAAVAAAAVLFGLPRAQGPESVSAGEVLQRALGAYSSGRTWQAEAVLKVADWNRSGVGYHYDVMRYHLIQSADGSYRLTKLGPTRDGGTSAASSAASSAATSRRVTDDVAYDASTGVLRRYTPGRGLVVMKDYPLGPPDRWASPLTGVDFGATGRALQAAGSLTLEDTVVDGRPAWTVTCTKGAGVPRSGFAQGVDWPVYKITTDKRTWLPIRFQQVEAGILMADLRYSNVRIGQPLPRDAFTLRPAEGMRIGYVDRGFRRVTLEEARMTAGVAPLVPGFVPRGYRLAHVAVAARALTVNHLVRARHVFALEYRHGFDALTVSARTIADPYYSPIEDPVDSYDPRWSSLVRTEAPITSGAFAGTTASVVLATTSSTPHLWAVKHGVLLTIAGGATARELLEIADSLQPYPEAPASQQ